MLATILQYIIFIVILLVLYYYVIDVEFVKRPAMERVVNADPYFDRMSDVDLKVRGATSIADYRRKYIAGCVEFNESEKAELKYLIRTLSLDWKYLPSKWRIVKLSNGIENNWPHTLGNVICLPGTFFDRPDKRIVLRHEAIHVWQRANRPYMERWIKEQGWKPVARPLGMVNNPDIDEFAYERNGTLSILSYLPDAATMKDTVLKTHYGTHVDNTDHPYEEYAKQMSKSSNMKI
jgi:hypothetical protein